MFVMHATCKFFKLRLDCIFPKRMSDQNDKLQRKWSWQWTWILKMYDLEQLEFVTFCPNTRHEHCQCKIHNGIMCHLLIASQIVYSGTLGVILRFVYIAEITLKRVHITRKQPSLQISIQVFDFVFTCFSKMKMIEMNICEIKYYGSSKHICYHYQVHVSHRYLLSSPRVIWKWYTW